MRREGRIGVEGREGRIGVEKGGGSIGIEDGGGKMILKGIEERIGVKEYDYDKDVKEDRLG